VTGIAKRADELASTTSPPVVGEIALGDEVAFEERVKQLSEKQLRELLLKKIELNHKIRLPSRGSILFQTSHPPPPLLSSRVVSSALQLDDVAVARH